MSHLKCKHTMRIPKKTKDGWKMEKIQALEAKLDYAQLRNKEHSKKNADLTEQNKKLMEEIDNWKHVNDLQEIPSIKDLKQKTRLATISEIKKKFLSIWHKDLRISREEWKMGDKILGIFEEMKKATEGDG